MWTCSQARFLTNGGIIPSDVPFPIVAIDSPGHKSARIAWNYLSRKIEVDPRYYTEARFTHGWKARSEPSWSRRRWTCCWPYVPWIRLRCCRWVILRWTSIRRWFTILVLLWRLEKQVAGYLPWTEMHSTVVKDHAAVEAVDIAVVADALAAVVASCCCCSRWRWCARSHRVCRTWRGCRSRVFDGVGRRWW